jgi:ABC-type glycerol-3-phosphate transport system permease component
MTIPVELEEAARIDGANTLQILTRLIVPLSTPALATMAIFTFLWSWNDFFTPFVFINSPMNYTVTVGLNMFKGHFTTNYEVLMAASVVVITPTIVLFFFLQRYFIEGIQLTGLKG